MIASILRSFGFISYAEAKGLADKALADMVQRTFNAEREAKRLRLTAEHLTEQHLAMHRRMVDAEKGLAHSEEEVKFLKSILAEERQRSMSLVTQKVTRMSPPVTEKVVKPLKRKRVS